jgi:Asp-tRNA(Asn)/Glu-tRNA(Gln) amidotransferase B subunit
MRRKTWKITKLALLITELRGPVLSEEKIEEIIKKTIEEHREELDSRDSMKMKENYLFGYIMRQLKGRADSRLVREILIGVLDEVYSN